MQSRCVRAVAFAGAAAAPQPPRLSQRGRRQQVQQQQAPTVEALLQARRMADKATKAFEVLKGACRRPPTLAVYESTQ